MTYLEILHPCLTSVHTLYREQLKLWQDCHFASTLAPLSSAASLCNKCQKLGLALFLDAKKSMLFFWKYLYIVKSHFHITLPLSQWHTVLYKIVYCTCILLMHIVQKCPGLHTRFWYLSHWGAAKAQTSLPIWVDLSEPSLLTYTTFRCRGRFSLKFRPLNLLDTSAWLFKGASAIMICTKISGPYHEIEKWGWGWVWLLPCCDVWSGV